MLQGKKISENWDCLELRGFFQRLNSWVIWPQTASKSCYFAWKHPWLEQLGRKCQIVFWHAALTVTPPLWWHVVFLPGFPITATMTFKDMNSIMRLHLVSLPYSPVPQFVWELTKPVGVHLEWMSRAAHSPGITNTSLWKFWADIWTPWTLHFGSDRCCGSWNHSEKNRG